MGDRGGGLRVGLVRGDDRHVQHRAPAERTRRLCRTGRVRWPAVDGRRGGASSHCRRNPAICCTHPRSGETRLRGAAAHGQCERLPGRCVLSQRNTRVTRGVARALSSAARCAQRWPVRSPGSGPGAGSRAKNHVELGGGQAIGGTKQEDTPGWSVQMLMNSAVSPPHLAVCRCRQTIAQRPAMPIFEHQTRRIIGHPADGYCLASQVASSATRSGAP
jgi:hypothetical protein